MNQETQMQSDAQSVVEIFLKYENFDDDNLKYIFRKKIDKLSGEGLLPHNEYSINYKEKFCIFNYFDVDYETGEKTYTNYKIILKPKPKTLNLAFNIFKFN